MFFRDRYLKVKIEQSMCNLDDGKTILLVVRSEINCVSDGSVETTKPVCLVPLQLTNQ